MDIKEAIEVLKDENRDICYGTSYTKDAIKTAIEALERTRWIPVSDRLPTKEDAKNNRAGYVLVHRKSSVWDFDMCKWHNVEYLELATHWMPLPEPPQEGHQ